MKHTKLAYFLRGLGCGILFVTILMTVSARKSEKQDAAVQLVELSKEEIIAKAKEYGMEEGVGMKVDQLLDATQSQEPTESPKPEETVDTKHTEVPKATSTPEVESASELEFEVESGQSSREIADALEKIGLVEDAQEFNQYLEEYGYSTKIKAKTHHIPAGSSYKTIAKQLCN